MQNPLQIYFRDLLPSPAVDANIRERVSHLNQFYKSIISCRVTVGENRHEPNPRALFFYCHIDVRVPGRQITVGRHPDRPKVGDTHFERKELNQVIHGAFDEAERALREYGRIRRVRVHAKHREEPPQGTVARILNEQANEGYGFIRAEDGREIYFHSHSVLNDGFDRLEPGTPVRFAEEVGNDGPQASSVEILGHGRYRAGAA